MKCTACQLELVDSPKEHYKSELHKLNVQRQMYMIPPISQQEFEMEGASSDVSLDINFLEVKIEKEEKKKINKPKQKISFETCLFCEHEESYEHYLDHQLEDIEISYLLNKTCYVCNEGFTNKKSLKNHLQTENHRTAVIKGKNLVLENGKVIYNKGSSTSIISPANRSGDTNITNFSPKIEFAKDKNIVEKNKLKVSMGMNSQKHFRPDWMQ